MAIKPILFNAEMVKAIMEGRKTQTRRIIKLAPGFSGRQVGRSGNPDNPLGFMYPCGIKRPPCNKGDILWVRETWRKDVGRYMYRANYADYEKFYRDGEEAQLSWSPSIHMPHEAARIFLRVKDVRVERLQDCGNGWCIDIEKEGVKTPVDPILYVNDDEFHAVLRTEMEKLWDSTIKPADRDRYGWKANPWVWVIEFERCKRPEGWEK